VIRWTADTMPYACLLAAAAAWLAWELATALGNVRALVRDWRHRRTLDAVHEHYGITCRAGTPPKGARP
jgi:hypothetical protein